MSFMKYGLIAISGVCATHQRALQTAIKRARQIALVPYVTD